MKKILSLMSVLLLLILSAFTVLAHPGRTDSNGGHYNRSTGEYHYHHGYSAHQHPNGVCPYKSDDKTGSSSSSSNSTTNYYSSLKTTSPYRSYSSPKANDKNEDIYGYLFLATVIIIIILIVYIVFLRKKSKSQPIKQDSRTNKENNTLTRFFC